MKKTDKEYQVYLDNKYKDKYKELIGLIPMLKENFGEFITKEGGEGTIDKPFIMPFMNYSRNVDLFMGKVMSIADKCKELDLNNYYKILEKNKIDEVDFNVDAIDLLQLHSQCILAWLLYIVRGERFCDGHVLGYLKNGTIIKLLQRLSET